MHEVVAGAQEAQLQMTSRFAETLRERALSCRCGSASQLHQALGRVSLLLGAPGSSSLHRGGERDDVRISA